ncbi:50S ribosomal protein L22 [Smittium mucronatum]|uniref:50S ribosomal protein L22 n=1 Tax=Smittium mucronatum TaxID=133383 RepID=A0A1R0H1W0_9FUNG|nr:50S ribosomal protein L22 [Smittium mucronatum]
MNLFATSRSSALRIFYSRFSSPSTTPVFGKGFHTSIVSLKKDEEEKIKTPKSAASSLFGQAEADLMKKTFTADQVSEKSLLEKTYRYSTSNFKTSPKKLRFIAKQIAGLKVQDAINQLEFSPKRAAKKILHTVAFARKNAIYQKLFNPDQMYIKEAWVGKGRFSKRLDYKARGRFGVVHHPTAHMKIVLGEDKAPLADSPGSLQDNGKRRNIKGFGEHKKFVWKPLMENKPIYNCKPYYNW